MSKGERECVCVCVCTCSGAGKQDRVCEAQLCGVKVMMVCRMSLHQVPWMESEPVKKSAHTQQVSHQQSLCAIRKDGWKEGGKEERDDGREGGRKEGMKKGRKEGMKKGRNEGREKGRKESS